MGDAADDAMERAFDEWIFRDEYDLEPEDDYPPLSYRWHTTTGIRCKFCYKTGFVWGKVSGKWRLVTAVQGKVHSCSKWRPATVRIEDIDAKR